MCFSFTAARRIFHAVSVGESCISEQAACICVNEVVQYNFGIGEGFVCNSSNYTCDGNFAGPL